MTDDEVIAAMKMLFQHEGLVAEGAGKYTHAICFCRQRILVAWGDEQ